MSQTKRRYAHELYPHPDEYEIRPLAVDVPYLYARAIGLGVWGTGWMEAEPKESVSRTNAMIAARHLAFAADALQQGLVGDEAWQWVSERSWDYEGEWVWERAVHYGVDPDAIKPYPCGPEPTHHDHLGTPDRFGSRIVTRAPGPESDCAECCEPPDGAS